MSDADLLADYRRDQRRRGHQPTSIVKRDRFLLRFAGWLGADLLTATADDVQRFLDRPLPLSAKTRYSYLDYLHGFYTWARHAGHTATDPTVAIPRPKLPRRMPRPISTADLSVALAVAPPRERAIVALAAYEGMRCIEIARLTREDILDDEDPAAVVVYGKGSKERVVPLHQEAWRALQLLPLPRSGAVFRLVDGRQANSWNISEVGNRYLHGIGSDSTMHQLRHWFGTHLYRTSGHDLLLVAALMGHESPTTTAIYARYDRAGARGAVAALSARTDTSDADSSTEGPDRPMRVDGDVNATGVSAP